MPAVQSSSPCMQKNMVFLDFLSLEHSHTLHLSFTVSFSSIVNLPTGAAIFFQRPVPTMFFEMFFGGCVVMMFFLLSWVFYGSPSNQQHSCHGLGVLWAVRHPMALSITVKTCYHCAIGNKMASLTTSIIFLYYIICLSLFDFVIYKFLDCLLLLLFCRSRFDMCLSFLIRFYSIPSLF